MSVLSTYRRFQMLGNVILMSPDNPGRLVMSSDCQKMIGTFQ